MAGEIASILEAAGYEVERWPFTFSTAAEGFLKAGILLALLLALAAWLARGGPWGVLAGALLLAWIGVLPLLYGRLGRRAVSPGGEPGLTTFLLRLWGPRRSANVAAELPGSHQRPSLPRLILMAHYDSKSQPYPLTLRVALFVAAIAAGLALGALSLAEALIRPTGAALPAASALVLASGIPLLFLNAGNRSPGAIDNASGVGLALHLAEVLAGQTGLASRLRVSFLFTGAEELGLMGAAAAVRRDEASLRRQAEEGGLYVLNLDGVGVDGDLYLVEGDPRGELARQLEQACEMEELAARRFRLPGALFDHIPFAESGMQAASLIAIGPASRHIHTPADAPGVLHRRGFDQAGRVVLRFLEILATD